MQAAPVAPLTPGLIHRCARRSPVTRTQLFGYGLAFLGVMYYNYAKVEQMKASAAAAQKAPEKQPLVESGDQQKSDNA